MCYGKTLNMKSCSKFWGNLEGIWGNPGKIPHIGWNIPGSIGLKCNTHGKGPSLTLYKTFWQIYVHMHLQIYIYMYLCINVCMFVCTYNYANICTHAFTDIYIHASMYKCMHVCMYI